ncbi:MAG: 50S ribosomal protein L35 [Bdellovibrio sp.]|nr:MAG: 50S ribosomal protein L35 [Bdellovibrio sp.]
MAKTKMKTHSGAKKRFGLLKSGKVKRKQTRLRHLNSHMSSKTKRHLGEMVYVSPANMLQVKRQLGF